VSDLTRFDRIFLGLVLAVAAAWVWLDAFFTILERTS
jgi:hypothetical protein